MQKSQADKEFMKGVRYVEEGGRTYAERDRPICDFCLGSPDEHPIRWSYPAGEVRLNPDNPVAQVSTDDWGACDGCHELIEAGDFDGLFERSFDQQVTRFMKVDPKELPSFQKLTMKHEAVRIWNEFREARTGPAVPEEVRDG